MQLLITQLQNQDPTSPMDPSTFVTQLVEVNNLDQVSQINQLLQSTLAVSSSTTQLKEASNAAFFDSAFRAWMPRPQPCPPSPTTWRT